jgi:hypothetical protein
MISHHIRLIKVVEYCKAHVGEVLTIASARAMFSEEHTETFNGSCPTKSMIENTFNRALDIEGFALFVDGLVYETPEMRAKRIAQFHKQQLIIMFAELTALEQEKKVLLEQYLQNKSRLEKARSAILARVRKVM